MTRGIIGASTTTYSRMFTVGQAGTELSAPRKPVIPSAIQSILIGKIATLGQSLAAENSEQFVHQAARFLAELNAIHPFREGNGRAQLAFMSIIGQRPAIRSTSPPSNAIPFCRR
jgi:hypothetical protein